MKRTNTCIMGILGGGEKDKRTESIFKTILAENFSNLGREIGIQIQEAQKSPNRVT